MRVCWNCTHIYFDGGEPAWSEMTPGCDASLECTKSHWRMNYNSHGADDLRRYLLTAQSCKDYQHSEKAKELGILDGEA